MKSTLFFLALIFSLGISHAQVVQNSQKLVISFNPSSVLDPRSPTIRGGLEYKPISQLGLYVDYGHQFEKYSPLRWNRSILNNKYSKFRSEIKYYFLEGDRVFFAGLQFLFLNQSYTKLNDYVNTKDDKKMKYEQSNIEKDVLAYSLIIGMQHRLSDRFGVEIYAAYGIRFLNIKHDLQNAVEVEELPFTEFYTPADQSEGKTSKNHLDLGFKLQYTLVRQK